MNRPGQRLTRYPRREKLIVFTRHPTPGKVKTRLIPQLGSGGAASLHRAMTEHTLDWARQLSNARGVSLAIQFTDADAAAMRHIFGRDLDYEPQCQGDLGDRLSAAFDRAFAAGAQSVVVVGTDTPGLSLELAARAFEVLQTHHLVLGPALDGGYYLIGLRRRLPALFRGVAWGTERVLRQTRAIADAYGLRRMELESLSDIDRPEDLPVWDATQRQPPIAQVPDLISVIIPTRNESAHLQPLLTSLATDPLNEVLVADGGSTDNTVEQARAFGTQVVISASGRARQMNSAARLARGEILLFLHADTRLPQGWATHVRNALRTPGIIGGAFRLRIASSRRALRVVEWAANQRAARFQLPYGDQAIFLRAQTFRALGGYADWPLLEDVDLARRLRLRGRLALLPDVVETSARRWHEWGVARTTWRNAVALGAYFWGTDPVRIARWYRR